jgi:hypothetical protein
MGCTPPGGGAGVKFQGARGRTRPWGARGAYSRPRAACRRGVGPLSPSTPPSTPPPFTHTPTHPSPDVGRVPGDLPLCRPRAGRVRAPAVGPPPEGGLGRDARARRAERARVARGRGAARGGGPAGAAGRRGRRRGGGARGRLRAGAGPGEGGTVDFLCVDVCALRRARAPALRGKDRRPAPREGSRAGPRAPRPQGRSGAAALSARRRSLLSFDAGR